MLRNLKIRYEFFHQSRDARAFGLEIAIHEVETVLKDEK